MDRKEIISMAREAGMPIDSFLNVDYALLNEMTFWRFNEVLERFAQLVAAAEREACAKVCDELQDVPATEPRHCAADIRARGQQ